jgi:hypothetical protein
MRAEVGQRRLQQAGKCGDQGAGLVQVTVIRIIRVRGSQAELLGGGGHQHDGGPTDHLAGGDVGQVAVVAGLWPIGAGGWPLVGAGGLSLVGRGRGGLGQWWRGTHTV